MGTSVSEHMPKWPTSLLFLLIALPGISLTGALAAGMFSKWEVKHALYEFEQERIIALLTWAAMGTAALVTVCVWRQWQQRQRGNSHSFQWGGVASGIDRCANDTAVAAVTGGECNRSSLERVVGHYLAFSGRRCRHGVRLVGAAPF